MTCFAGLCLLATLVQTIAAQCIGIPEVLIPEPVFYEPAYSPYGCNYGPEVVPTNGRGFTVISYSPIAPTGIIVQSENAIEGAVSIAGELPFISAVTIESVLPTAGVGAINYGCGNGAVGIVAENVNPIAPVYSGIAPFGAPYGAPFYGAPGFPACY